MRYALLNNEFLSGPMKWIFIFGIALLVSFSSQAQDKFTRLSDSFELQIPGDSSKAASLNPGLKGACYALHTFKSRGMQKLPGFPQTFNESGRVVLSITVNPEGKVIAYTLLSTDPGCFKVAKETLKYLQFPELDASPAKLQATISFIFQKGTD